MENKNYTFPFDTCEKPNKNGIAQPYSVFLNLLICTMIATFLQKAKSVQSKILLITILIFELFHAYSHYKHVSGSIQINITHLLAYFMNFAFLFLFYKSTNHFPNDCFLLWLLFLVFLDLYLVYNYSFIYYLISMSLIYISLLCYYYSYFSEEIKNKIYYIIFMIILIILLFINEKKNCKKNLEKYPDFPFHVIIEFNGLILFYIICDTFYKL